MAGRLRDKNRFAVPSPCIEPESTRIDGRGSAHRAGM